MAFDDIPALVSVIINLVTIHELSIFSFFHKCSIELILVMDCVSSTDLFTFINVDMLNTCLPGLLNLYSNFSAVQY